MANTESPHRKAYKAEWAKSHTRQIKLKLVLTTDADIIEHLDSMQNKQGYIKELIRADIAKRKGEKYEHN